MCMKVLTELQRCSGAEDVISKYDISLLGGTTSGLGDRGSSSFTEYQNHVVSILLALFSQECQGIVECRSSFDMPPV
jgi:hypothetical protein